MAANVMFHQFGRIIADRVFRERFSIDNMCEGEIQRRYRFGKDSIKQIVDLIDPIIGPKSFLYSVTGISLTNKFTLP